MSVLFKKKKTWYIHTNIDLITKYQFKIEGEFQNIFEINYNSLCMK